VAALAVPLMDRVGNATPTGVVQVNTTPSQTPPPSLNVTKTLALTQEPAVTPTLRRFELLQTAQMQLTHAAATLAAADLRATQDTMLNENATGTAQQIMATEVAAQATLLALSWTPTLHPTNTPVPPTSISTATRTPTPVPPTKTPDQVTNNAQWKPQFQTFDGVEMAKVPPGCFMMGSDDGDSDEKPTTKICFEKPFWIDKTEVTQAQFREHSGQAATSPSFKGDSRPVEQVTWFEAHDFCIKRGGRLPTEAEWEYAARGPDNLVYPWRNSFVADNVVYFGNSAFGTANAGSKPGGASWVGTLDMIGNVWEWVSTIYKAYPYDATDGRENNSDHNSARVLRGGSWYLGKEHLRTAVRNGVAPSSDSYDYGFRCSRS
jgi:formylglycine-generating enzyme required for sulfatase activity